MNKKLLKNILKHLVNEKVSLHAGNLAYCTIIALIPSFIIIMSLFNLFSNHLATINAPYFSKLNYILNYLNLSTTSNIIIDLICINLLSSGIFSLISTFQNLYNFNFKNYIRKKLYSYALSLIIVLIIVLDLSISFSLSNIIYLKQIIYLTNYLIVFLSLLFLYKLTTFQKLKNIYPGTIISSLIFTLFISLFTTIIDNFTNISNYYGTFTPIILLFLLIYYSCFIIYGGVIINFEIYKTQRIKCIKV